MTVTLNSHAATAALLQVPGVGLWYASVDLADETAIEVGAPATLRILDTTWVGTVIAGAALDGRSRYRIVAGRGGWGKDLPARAYANDAGVTVAQVAADAALEAGELPPIGASAVPQGPHYARSAGPASFTLNLLAPRNWYANTAGVVTFGERLLTPGPTAPVVARNPAARMVELALTDTLANVAPGAATEFGAASDVEVEISEAGLRARLYASPARSRRVDAYARLLRAVFPYAEYAGVFEYRVVSQVGERLNLQPVRSARGLPDLARVPVRAGVPGVKALHSPGSQVLVAFVDGDATRPAVVGFDSPEQPGWMPLQLELGGPMALGVARVTDPVQAGPFVGVITAASLRVKASL